MLYKLLNNMDIVNHINFQRLFHFYSMKIKFKNIKTTGSEKLENKAKINLQKFKKLSMQFHRQQNSALNSEFSRL